MKIKPEEPLAAELALVSKLAAERANFKGKSDNCKGKHQFVAHREHVNNEDCENMRDKSMRMVATYPFEYEVNQNMFGVQITDERTLDFDQGIDAQKVEESVIVSDMVDTSTRLTPILDKVTPVENGIFDKERDLVVQTMRNNDRGDLHPKFDIHIKGGRNLANNRFKDTVGVRATKNRGLLQQTSVNHTINTMVERYGKVPLKRITKAQIETRANELYGALKSMIKKGVVESFSKTDHGIKMVENIVKIAAKPLYPTTGVYGDGSSATEIKCFPKQQLKCKTDPGSKYCNIMGKEENDVAYIKGGQMVSAQSKEINQICGPLVGCIDDLWHKLLKPEFRYCMGENDMEFIEGADEMLSKREVGARYYCYSFDITQQDTVRGRAFDLALSRLYEELGFPSDISRIMRDNTKNWKVKTMDAATMTVDTYTSGAANTTSSNSQHSAAEILTAYQFEGMLAFFFKGDDIGVVAQDCKQIHKRSYIKQDVGDVGTFIGFLYDSYGIYPDYPRLAARLTSKLETDNARHEELRLGVKDQLTGVYKNQTHYQQGIYANSSHYSITVGEVEVLADYLHTYANPKRTLKPGNMKRFNNYTGMEETITRRQKKNLKKRAHYSDSNNKTDKFSISRNNRGVRRTVNEFEYNNSSTIYFKHGRYDGF